MKKKLLKATPVALILTVFIACSIGIYYNSHVFFVFFEKNGAFLDPVTVETIEISDTVGHTLEQLESDERVTFDRSLMLVNTEYMLPEGFVPMVEEYKDTDVFMGSEMIAAYASLSDAVRAEFDHKLYVSSDFRTREEQEQLFSEMPDTATAPGASEHELGLALDVYVAYYAGDAFIKSPVGRFVNTECHKYGFIIRYPSFGEDITGIRYEPWHIRYVGEPHARIIYNNHLTLEEYILSLEPGTWYSAEGYLISRQKPDKNGCLTLPESFESSTISPDNTGHYIITVEE